jgi:predicted transcriptional regulator
MQEKKPAPELTEAQRAELDRRLDLLASEPVRMIPWDEVPRDLDRVSEIGPRLPRSPRSRRPVMRAKETVRDLLERLPDDCTFEDVLYHVYVAQQVEEGTRAARDGRVIPHEQVMRELRRKWLGGGPSSF